MTHSLSNTNREKITAAIKHNELNTAGEIYCVVARKSASYFWVVLAWGMFLALLIPALFALFNIDLAQIIFGRLQAWSSHNRNDINSDNIYVLLLLQALIFLCATMIGRNRGLLMAIVPKFIKRQGVHKYARDQFLAHGIHQTDDRTGVLIYVSLAEHMVEIVADKGIYTQVDKAVWGEAVAKILIKTKEGDLTDGLIDGINDIGAILAAHFPPSETNENEISDSVVFI